MGTVLFVAFCTFSITQIIAESTFFAPLRGWLSKFGEKWLVFLALYKLTSCFLCTSVWVSFFMVLCLPSGRFEHGLFFDAMFYSCIVWFMRLTETYLTK